MDLEEARRAWELGKSLSLSYTNKIDVIWAMVKESKSKKAKKTHDSRAKSRGRKKGKEKI